MSGQISVYVEKVIPNTDLSLYDIIANYFSWFLGRGAYGKAEGQERRKGRRSRVDWRPHPGAGVSFTTRP